MAASTLAVEPSPAVPETARSPVVRRGVALFAWVLLVVSLLAWRTGVFYSGGLDPVVIGKALLDVVALGIAFILVKTRSEASQLTMRTPFFVLAFVAVSMVGAVANDSLSASGVLAVRLLVVIAVAALLVVATPLDEVVCAVGDSFALVGLVCGVTGLGTLAADGRLSGGVLPIQANQIALLVGLPLVIMVWRIANNESRRFELAGAVTMLGLLWLSGSRSGLAAVVLAGIIVVLTAPKLRAPVFVGMLASLPIAFFALAFSGVLTAFFGRGGAQSLLTLNSRTIAWKSAFTADTDFWRRWLGGGLSVKMVAVKGTYWDSQVLDSSWVSAFVQAGIVGVLVMALWMVSTVWGALRTDPRLRSLWLGLVMLAAIRSVVESGLLDSYALLLVILLPSFAVDLVDPRRAADQHSGLAWTAEP